MTIKSYIENSYIVRNVYSGKWYADLGIKQISWITGKLPELMATIYLSEWLGLELSKSQVIVFAIGFSVGLICFGYFWKHTGLYNAEMKVAVSKDPIQNEIYTAALKINRR